MASKSIFACIILLIVLCLLLMREPSPDCSSVHGCFGVNATGFKEAGNRKVLAALRVKKTTLPGYGGSSSSKSVKDSATPELRKVPSGPDPLHHNGGSPNKPKTP
ncbi:protein CLAVATA 3 [Neltuma alba]|uniref:protein CLAVATA 3 n=1 Tax=Neltuma alba TaxID=207710 RepID=UPI0010A312CB|nr:protein CLAVATA 3 [Prosopis alba]XP_028808305.1 protein CLAVATA 3 [Prosopis alba]